MATFGLAINLMLWSVPLTVGAAGLPHALFPTSMPDLAQVLDAAQRTSGPSTNLLDALVQLVGAESEALQVAGIALQQPLPADIAPRADAAGLRVREAVVAYVRAFEALHSH
jgi:hypothetical protein